MCRIQWRGTKVGSLFPQNELASRKNHCWISTELTNRRSGSRNKSFLLLTNQKQIFSKTSITIQNLYMIIDFEFITFIFEAFRAMRQAKFCQEHFVHAYPSFKIWISSWNMVMFVTKLFRFCPSFEFPITNIAIIKVMIITKPRW